jgi:hypothetical protein
MYHKTRTIVYEAFRQDLLEVVPGLKDNPSYWEFTGLLAWGLDLGKGIIISREILAQIERKIHLLKGHRYNGKEFLEKYSRDVMHIEYSAWDFDQYRTITKVAWPDRALEIIEREKNRMYTGKRVYIGTGLEYTKARQSKEREYDKEYALSQMVLAANDEAIELMRYLNTLPENRFQHVLKHIDKAYELASAIENTKSKHEQIANLRAIQDQYQVFYIPKPKTVRVFSLNLGLTYIQRDLRKVLTQDWIELDLQNAQLAIAAKYWNISELQTFLETGKSMWNELFSYFGLEFNEYIKQHIFKKAVYALMYGMGKDNLKNGNNKFAGLNPLLAPYGIVNGGDLFLAHPLIKAILRQRGKMLKEIRNNYGAANIYGVWIPVNANQKETSVLAQLMQAIELHLLYPVVELAKSTDQFQIMIWQHDGFSIYITDKRRKDLWLARIKASVQERIDSLGIITKLV